MYVCLRGCLFECTGKRLFSITLFKILLQNVDSLQHSAAGFLWLLILKITWHITNRRKLCQLRLDSVAYNRDPTNEIEKHVFMLWCVRKIRECNPSLVQELSQGPQSSTELSHPVCSQVRHFSILGSRKEEMVEGPKGALQLSFEKISQQLHTFTSTPLVALSKTKAEIEDGYWAKYPTIVAEGDNDTA